jgi:hypothetical protein
VRRDELALIGYRQNWSVVPLKEGMWKETEMQKEKFSCSTWD